MRLLYLTCHLDVSGVTRLNLDILKRLGNDTTVFVATTEQEPSSGSLLDRFMWCPLPPLQLWRYPAGERLRVLADFLQSNAIDLVFITHSQWGYEQCAKLKHLMPAIRIVDALHVLEPFFLRGGFPDISAHPFVHRHLDATICISHDLRNYIIRNYAVNAGRIHVVKNGVDLSRYSRFEALNGVWKKELGLPAEARLVGYIGRMTPQKRPELFVHIAGEMLKKMPSLHFYMIGSGPLAGDIARIAASKTFSGRLHCFGRMDDIPLVLHSTDLLLVPSAYEGAPLTIIEALSVGVPVVASDVGAIREYVGDYCQLVPVGRGEAGRLQERACAVLSGDTRAGAVGGFNIAATAAGYRQVFQDVCPDRPNRGMPL